MIIAGSAPFRPYPTRAAAPEAQPDQVTLGADLEKAGYSFGKCGPWYGTGKTEPVNGVGAEELLRQKKAVEVKTPRGYETLFDFSELEALHALWSNQSELARTMNDLKQHGVKLGSSHHSSTQSYQALAAGKAVEARVGESQPTFVRGLDELKAFSCFQGHSPVTSLERPERARSIKLLDELGLTAPPGYPNEPLQLYRLPADQHVVLGRLSLQGKDLDDSVSMAQRLAPLRELSRRLKDPTTAQEAELMVRTVPSELPLEEKLDRAELAFSFPGPGQHDLYRTLVEPEQSLQQARGLKARLDAWQVRDALVALRKLPGQEKTFGQLLELCPNPGWAAKTLEKLGPNPTREQLETAGWSRLKWHHPTALLTARQPLGEETREQRERALARLYGDCQADFDATRQVWGELRHADSLEQAMQAHRLLNGVLHQVRVRGPGWWEAECLKTLRQERRPGGALQGLSMTEGVERLLPFLQRGAQGLLLHDHSAKEVVEGALHRLKTGESARTGVEEREGGVIVGGVRVPTRQ